MNNQQSKMPQSATGGRRVSKQTLINAIRANAGIIANIAFALGFGKDRKKVYRYIKRYGIQDEVEHARELFVDLCEGKLINDVNNDNMASVYFVLRTLGRKRGYGEHVEVEESGKVLLILDNNNDGKFDRNESPPGLNQTPSLPK